MISRILKIQFQTARIVLTQCRGTQKKGTMSAASDISPPPMTAEDALSLQRVLGIVRMAQQKLKQERQQILVTLEQQIREVRLDQLQISESAVTTKIKLDQLLARTNLVWQMRNESSTAPSHLMAQKQAVDDAARSLETSLQVSSAADPSRRFDGMNASSSPPFSKYATFSMDTPPPSTRYGGGGSSGAAATSSVTSANPETEKQLAILDASLQRATEEVVLLKTAVFQDRAAREDRQKMLDAEDEVVEQRIRQIESANDSIRTDMQSLRSTVRRLAEALETVRQFEHKHAAPPQFNIYELDRLVLDVEATMERVRTEHAALQGKTESLEAFTRQEESSRRQALEKLEASLSKLEAHVMAEEAAKRHAPFRPQEHDVSTDWAKNSRLPPETAAGTERGLVPNVALQPVPHLRRMMQQFDESTTARTTQRRRDELASTLTQFYATYNPDKIMDVEHILDEYEGAEEELLAALEVHYGCFGYFSQ